MTQQFFIPGSLPNLNDMVKAAHARKGRWDPYDKLKKETELIIFYAMKKAKIQPMRSCRFRFVFAEVNKRRDPDNIISGVKYILDAIVWARVLGNDGWGEVLGIDPKWEVDRVHPGVLVTMEGTPCGS